MPRETRDLLNEICHRFAAAWTGDNTPSLEDFVREVEEPIRDVVLRELVLIEWRQRIGRNECPTAEEYENRFPGDVEAIRLALATLSTDLGILKEDPEFANEGATFLTCYRPDQTRSLEQPRQGSPSQPSWLEIPGYEILEQLGQGGMGEVYKARKANLDRLVALKVIRRDHLTNLAFVDRFHREVRAAARLSHPNLVLAYDADEFRGMLYFTMEYVEGENLADRVKQRGPLPVDEACSYIRQTALALQHAFEHGLVHRDIKPSNLLVRTQDSLLKVADMGLAAIKQAEESESVMTDLTRSGVLGTPDYMSPEQALDTHTVDIRADLYSLGCTFYFLLTGRPPFPEGPVLKKLFRHCWEEPQPLTDLRPEVSPVIVAVIHRLMAKQPSDRYQTPAELARILEDGENIQIQTFRPLDQKPRSTESLNTSPNSLEQPGNPPDTPSMQDAQPPFALPATPPIAAPVEVPIAKPVTLDHLRFDQAQVDEGTATHLPKQSRRSERPLLLIVIGVALLMGGAVISVLAWSYFRSGTSPTAASSPEKKRVTLWVSRSRSDDHTFSTLGGALLEVKRRQLSDGVRILVETDLHESILLQNWSRVSIEAAEGKEITWTPSPQDKSVNGLLILGNAPEWKIKGFTLDGEGKTTDLITLWGRCPGLVLEDLKLKGFTRSGVLLGSCAGGSGENQEILLDNLDLTTSAPQQRAIYFTLFPHIPAVPQNEHVIIRDCTFVGRGAKVATADLNHINAVNSQEIPKVIQDIPPPKKPIP